MDTIDFYLKENIKKANISENFKYRIFDAHFFRVDLQYNSRAFEDL